MTYMGRTQIGHVTHTRIINDDTNVDLSQIEHVMSSVTGKSMYDDLDLDALNDRILAIPGVRKSAIRRMPNGELVANVSLHHAVATWTDDGETFYPLSGDGTVIKRPTNIRTPGTIVFRGTIPNDITDITRAAHILTGHVDYLTWVEGRRWNLYTTGGTCIKLPEENPSAALDTILKHHTHHNLLNKDLEYIDMRDPRRTLVKPRK